MKATTVTFASIYEYIKGEPHGDIFSEIVAIGYDEDEAKIKALNKLKYACCTDFTTPASCKPGTNVDYFMANGYILEDSESIEDAEDKLSTDLVAFDYNGNKYVFPNNYQEYIQGGSILSDDVKHFDSWAAVNKWLGIHN